MNNTHIYVYIYIYIYIYIYVCVMLNICSKCYSTESYETCQYLNADTCHMRCNALDSLPGRAFGRYDSDCSVGNSDPFAIALLSHKDQCG